MPYIVHYHFVPISSIRITHALSSSPSLRCALKVKYIRFINKKDEEKKCIHEWNKQCDNKNGK